MCGIAGAFRFDGAPDARPVPAMAAALAHRGPDAGRVAALEHGVLAARRLAIVDVEGGSNPLPDAGGRTWTALNGEVYEHRRLRSELSARGARFVTATDTEVAGCLFAELGPRALDRIDGMFALAVVDLRGERLWLARDRLGQKPLYWTRLDDGTLLFASELKGLLVHPRVRREVDPVAVEALLLFEYVPAPRTIYRGIHKIEAGTVLEADAAGLRLRRYWQPPLPHGGLAGGTAAWARSIRASLESAVARRQVAEVEVGWLLSGGIDSSAVAALSASMLPQPIRTFSVVFDEPSFDESGPAASMAARIGARHVELRFPAGRLAEVLGALGRGLCEPLADGSLPATWVLAEGVRAAGCKVALSGDGADEHFGGYPTYLAHRLAGPAVPARRLLRAAADALPSSTDDLSATYLARRFAGGLGLPLPRRNQVWLGAFLPRELPELLGREAGCWEEVDRWGRVASGVRDPARRAMFLDQRLYLSEGVLQKVDRASMMHGLEVRSPFLDHRLVELAAGLPARALLAGRRTKVALRRAVADLLPPALVSRRKKGFGTPLGPWLKGPCTGLLDDLPERLEGVVAPEPVRRLVREHRAGEADHRRRLWTLLVLSRWWRGPWGPG